MRLTVVGLLAILCAGCQMSGPSCGRCSPERFCCMTSGPYFRCIDEMKARHAARAAARRDLAKLSSSCPQTCDYQAGFEQAYVDVAMGADGQVPPFPPKEYWKDKSRTCQGHQAAQDWFSGYADGAPRALACRAQYQAVPTSGPSGYHDGFGHSLANTPY